MPLPLLVGAALGAGAGVAVGGGVMIGSAMLSSAAIGASLGAAIGGQVHAGGVAAKAARQQADAQNDFTERSHEYDVELWNMQRDKIIADREQAVKVIQTKAENENKVAEYRDLTNLQRYSHELQIRNRQQDSLDAQYSKSTDIYNRQLTLNERSAKAATEDEYASLQQIEAEQRYNQNDAYIEFLENEGEMRARLASGRTGGKGAQTSYYALGQKMSAINAALSGAMLGTDSRIQEIMRDRESADLAAEAQRMLDPGELPETPVPFATPRSTFEYPRAVGEYDFGPKPIYGVYHSPSAAANQVWGNTISGIASTVGSFATAYAKA